MDPNIVAILSYQHFSTPYLLHHSALLSYQHFSMVQPLLY